MKLGSLFSDQINRGLRSKPKGLKVNKAESSSWQEELSGLPALSSEEASVCNWRLTISVCAFFFSALFLLGKTFTLQVINGRENIFKASANRILVERKLPERGLIFDREGQVLAKNVPGFRATLTYSRLPEDRRAEIIQKSADVLQFSKEQIEQKFTEAKLTPNTAVTLKSGISHEEKLSLDALHYLLPGIDVAQDILRSYPKAEIIAHTLGYLREISEDELRNLNFTQYLPGDSLGSDGLERNYEEILSGMVGRRLIEVDAVGNLIRVIAEEEAAAGKNLYLSLDIDFQEQSAELLVKAIEKYAATGGVFIAQEVKSGQILSLVTQPSFDNNLFSHQLTSNDYESLLNDSEKPLFNRAISGNYPPGSTVKLIVAAAALQEKVISPKTRIDDYPQVIKIGPWEFPDWTVAWGRVAHGILTVREAIAESCDIFFYKIGGGHEEIEGLGIEKLKIYFNLFGLGQKTGIDLPGEAKGLVPDPIWKQEVKHEDWFLGNTYHVSIGQGDLLASPIQILQTTNVVASQGKLLKPRLLQRIETADGQVVTEFEPEVVRKDFINKDYIKVVAEGMRMGVSDGIVYPLRIAKVEVAAKTGTAEFGTKNAKGEYETHAWVTGFAPYDNPEISFVLLLESGGASSNAAEAAREILDWYFGR